MARLYIRRASLAAVLPRVRRAPALAALFTLALLAGVLALRWSADFSNVDDYLYARQTEDYLETFGPSLFGTWRDYGQNTPLVPMLALPVAIFDTSPDALVLVQVVPLIVLLLSVGSILASLGVGPRLRWVAAAAIATLPPLLAYAAMYHFGLAATALTALAAAAYLRSERLRRRRPALLLGLALGLLALTRVMAPVYVVALAAAIAVDVVRTPTRRRMRNAALATAVAALVAAPWWLVAGPTAIDYLTTAGYGESQFTSEGSRLDIAGRRFTWTATELGWLLAGVLAALTAWAAVAAVRRQPGWRAAAWLLGASAAGFVALATSSNAGTGFALPLVALLGCAAVWGLGLMPPLARGVATAATLAAVVLAGLALFEVLEPADVDGRALWQVGTPGLSQARAALACDCDPPASDALADRVLGVVGERPTMLARGDALLNAEGLRFRAEQDGREATLLPPPARPAPAELDEVDFVVAGQTLAPYGAVDSIALALSLRAARFRPVLRRRLSERNEVIVWASP
jgi:4-amino-4-deoxy-L-arabinose transferase-like glycosyltransferase